MYRLNLWRRWVHRIVISDGECHKHKMRERNVKWIGFDEIWLVPSGHGDLCIGWLFLELSTFKLFSIHPESRILDPVFHLWVEKLEFETHSNSHSHKTNTTNTLLVQWFGVGSAVKRIWGWGMSWELQQGQAQGHCCRNRNWNRHKHVELQLSHASHYYT